MKFEREKAMGMGAWEHCRGLKDERRGENDITIL